MKESIKIFSKDLKNSFKDLLPIIIVVAFFQTFIIQSVPDNLMSIVIGLTIVAVGLALFIRGLELGIFPVGENLAIDFAKKGSTFWLLLLIKTATITIIVVMIKVQATILNCLSKIKVNSTNAWFSLIL